MYLRHRRCRIDVGSGLITLATRTAARNNGGGHFIEHELLYGIEIQRSCCAELRPHGIHSHIDVLRIAGLERIAQIIKQRQIVYRRVKCSYFSPFKPSIKVRQCSLARLPIPLIIAVIIERSAHNLSSIRIAHHTELAVWLPPLLSNLPCLIVKVGLAQGDSGAASPQLQLGLLASEPCLGLLLYLLFFNLVLRHLPLGAVVGNSERADVPLCGCLLSDLTDELVMLPGRLNLNHACNLTRI